MNTDMALMFDFSMMMLNGVCDFLSTPPVFYVFGLICFVLVCKGVKILMS